MPDAPQIPGFAMVWCDDFDGPAGSLPSNSNWTFETGPETNFSRDVLGSSPQNISLSGDSQLYITPLRDQVHNTWTSAKIYSNPSFRCDDGHKMIFQGQLRLGNNPNQIGIWPAFWALGEALRMQGPQHKDWPQCGEWDILEVINGDGVGHGTLHCKQSDGSDPGNGLTSRTINYQPGVYHTWGFQVDLSGQYENQTLSWWLDGNSYYTIRPSDLKGGQNLWNEVACSAFYLILNIAVGGVWPYDPLPINPEWQNIHAAPVTIQNSRTPTQDGFNSGMQVRYVAVYKSQPGYKGDL